MQKSLCVALLLTLLLVFLPSCSRNGDEQESSETVQESLQSSTTETSSQSSLNQSEEQQNDSDMESSQNANDVTPIPLEPTPAPEMSISEDASMVTIEKENIHGKTSLSITDSVQKKQILAYVDGLSSTNETFFPETGGSVYNVYVQRNNVVEQYCFTSQKTEDGFILAKKPNVDPTKWWLADGTSYDYLASFF